MKTVILAAGFGGRLWPLSTSDKPKQFQPLINGQSLIKYTYQLMREIISADELYVLTLQGLEVHVHAELPHTLWALNVIGGDNPNELILFKSSDQCLPKPKEFLASLQRCIDRLDGRVSKELVLACMENDYGPNYGFAVVDDSGRIVAFVEKPSPEAYSRLLRRGKAYRSPFIMPVRKRACSTYSAGRQAAFLALPKIDISTGLFQTAIGMRTELIDCDFVDVGRFATLYELGDKEANDNVLQGNIVLGENCHGNFAINQLTAPLVLQHLRVMVVVQTAAGNVVAPIEYVDPVGEIYKAHILKRSENDLKLNF